MHISIPLHIRNAVKAAEIEKELIARTDIEFTQTGHVADDESHWKPGRDRPLLGYFDHARNEIDSGRVPSMPGEVNAIRSSATAQIESFAWRRMMAVTFNECNQLGGRDARIPGLESNQVRGAEEEAH